MQAHHRAMAINGKSLAALFGLTLLAAMWARLGAAHLGLAIFIVPVCPLVAIVVQTAISRRRLSVGRALICLTCVLLIYPMSLPIVFYLLQRLYGPNMGQMVAFWNGYVAPLKFVFGIPLLTGLLQWYFDIWNRLNR